MIKLNLTLLSSLLIGCSSFHAAPYQDKELRPFIAEFEEAYGISINYTVTFGDTGEYIGECEITPYYDGYIKRKVIINKVFYDENTYYSRQQLLFHEFGHCSFNLEHNTQLLDNGQPVSIMYPTEFGYSSYYKTHLSYYMEQLWTSYINYVPKSTNWKTSQKGCHSY